MRSPATILRHPRAGNVINLNVPAPVEGWNARDALAEMGNKDAIKLLNWFPRTTYCEIRGGSTSHLTGIPTASAKTLMTYNAPLATNAKMFVSNSAGVYDATVAGAAGASVATCTLGKWQWLNYAAVSGTTYLIMVNGQDKPLYFDGTTWIPVDAASTPALTGITTTKLIHVELFKNRLFFLEKDKMNFWYLPVQQAGGALTEFVLGSLAPRGGFMMAMGTWTIDAGTGVDDHAVFVTSEGEAIVFKGSDPSSSTNWTHVGTFFVGRPLGRNCFSKFGGDLVLLVEGGVYPLSQALLSASIDRSKALTDKISKAFLEAVQTYGLSTYGWQALTYTAQGALIVNIPQVEDGAHRQYVMNTVSKAWCEFDSWNAESLVSFRGQLYFCGGSTVTKAWTGRSDVGSTNIVADAKTAFNYFGGSSQKRVTLFRPLLMVDGSLSFSIGINVDFEDTTPTEIISYVVPTRALWDTAIWDVDVWQAELQVFRDWRTPAAKLGCCVSAQLKIANSALLVQWVASDYAYVTAGIL